jgi:hypothetical protein
MHLRRISRDDILLCYLGAEPGGLMSWQSFTSSHQLHNSSHTPLATDTPL